MIVCAMETGSTWFDFGGLPSEATGDHSAVAGIPRFKEGFAREPIEFREEWTYEARPLLAGTRRALSFAACGVRQLVGRR
ncbi:MAG TPA: hypothetical protein VLA09_06735 [Longimicrobiales bacterium]|nr:hypothetical protein [Longimicrobiales bacterium]